MNKHQEKILKEFGIRIPEAKKTHEYTDEEIGKMCKLEINEIFLQNDESWKWPINNRFNATERAIRNLRQQEREGLELESSLAYWLALENEISRIVNNAV